MPGSPDLRLSLSNHVALGKVLLMMNGFDQALQSEHKMGDRIDMIETEIYTRAMESMLVDTLVLKGYDNTCLAEVRRCW